MITIEHKRTPGRTGYPYTTAWSNIPILPKEFAYAMGDDGDKLIPPRYPMPTTIGFQHTKYGVYLFDTVKGYDGMPLFRGYTRDTW